MGTCYCLVTEYSGNGAKARDFTLGGTTRRALQMVVNDEEVGSRS